MLRRRHVLFRLASLVALSAWLGPLGVSQAVAQSKPITIVALGDSLSAGYQLPVTKAFPVQLEAALKARGHAVTVINAGVSGDTSAAGLDRLAWAVPPEADAVIVELGANDALRGLDPAAARVNIDKILSTLNADKRELLVAGMRAPLNMPPAYRDSFDRIFPELAAKYGALLYPFFLEKIALQPKLNLPDGIHPTAEGVALIVADILPKVEELIVRVKARRGDKVGG